MNRVSPALNSPGEQGLNSLTLVNHWMSDLRAMPYRYSKKWRTPAEVRSTHVADCKGKAVALYQLMRVNGARNVRLIIGKHRSDDLKTHAWVEWETQYGVYLLDPTFNWTAIRPEERDPGMYIPFYAYDGLHKYCSNYYRPFYPAAVAQY